MLGMILLAMLFAKIKGYEVKVILRCWILCSKKIDSIILKFINIKGGEKNKENK